MAKAVKQELAKALRITLGYDCESIGWHDPFSEEEGSKLDRDADRLAQRAMEFFRDEERRNVKTTNK